jgi:hypothetical protein
MGVNLGDHGELVFSRSRTMGQQLEVNLNAAAVHAELESGTLRAEVGAPRADGVKTSGGDGYVGFESTFRACGFSRVAPPESKRVLMHRTL